MSNYYDPLVKCGRCGWVAPSGDWPSKCVFWGSREEPPEYEAWCAECGASWEESEDYEGEFE